MSKPNKMLEGNLYNPQEESLIVFRQNAKKLCHQYNSTPDNKIKKKAKIIKKLFNNDESCVIQAPFSCDYGFNIQFGQNFFANYGCVILDSTKVTIGDHVMFGPGVHIYTAAHPVDIESRGKGLESSLPVTIGSQVWIGGHATICPGVTIGNNVVISEGSVVTHSIPDNAVALGNPCEVIQILTK